MAVFPAGASDAPLGRGYGGQIQFTRPSNTTAYDALDVVGDTGGSAILTLPNAGMRGGAVQIQSVSLTVGVSSVPSGMAAFRLHAFVSSPTAIADNAPFNLAVADVSRYRGFVDIPAPVDFGEVLFAQSDYAGRMIRLGDGSTDLFFILQTIAAYTPSSATVYTLRVMLMEMGS